MPVRPADPDRDAQRCAEIYAPAITGGHASFEEEPPDAAEMALRIATGRAWLVAERDGVVRGYANAYPHNVREGYRWTANVAVYVDPAARRQGIGRELYAALLPRLRDDGLRWAVALIALPNAASVALHEAFGFERAGVLREIGYKHGAWHDVAYYQHELAAPGVVRAR